VKVYELGHLRSAIDVLGEAAPCSPSERPDALRVLLDSSTGAVLALIHIGAFVWILPIRYRQKT
jgi:hypothetical protein